MELLARIATWIDHVVSAVVAVVLRGAMATLAFVLRRGKHRAWRRRGVKS
jgi:hypothetical protein